MNYVYICIIYRRMRTEGDDNGNNVHESDTCNVKCRSRMAFAKYI